MYDNKQVRFLEFQLLSTSMEISFEDSNKKDWKI